MAGRNLVNFDRVSKAYGERPLLDDVSLGVGEGERCGSVGSHPAAGGVGVARGPSRISRSR